MLLNVHKLAPYKHEGHEILVHFYHGCCLHLTTGINMQHQVADKSKHQARAPL